MKEIEIVDAYFRAANYISVACLYLKDNPLLLRPLKDTDIKEKLVGHWGTVPGQNFIYTHLNRIIKKYDLNMLYISGPGHGGNASLAQSYLEGTFSEVYSWCPKNKEGMQHLFKEFSFPYGLGSHATPEIPGSMHEGGELGYSLIHAYGAVLDNPSLIAACCIGDGEAETATLATSWQVHKFLNPKRDGIVLPILHLNGYKISNPTIYSRMSNKELICYFTSLGYHPYIVEGLDKWQLHKIMMNTLDNIVLEIKKIKTNPKEKIYYPMIILRTKKGWTGPKKVLDKEIEGTFRAHQIPVDKSNPDYLKIIEDWLRSYHPEELFNADGTLKDFLEEYHPTGNRRMSANEATNGISHMTLKLPNPKDYLLDNQVPGKIVAQDMLELSKYIRDVLRLNKSDYRIFSPDEAMSNRLYHIFEVEKRTWEEKILSEDENLSNDGRIMDSFLSENVCEGLLEGYTLTGRYGTFVSYEAFIRVVDSMVSQYLKWLKMKKSISWRREIPSLNLILTSNVWQQDHNGYTHQDPGFIDHLGTKKRDLVNIYLPIDTNSLILTYDKCLKDKDKVNAIIASKHPTRQWLSKEEAKTLIDNGLIELKKFSTSDNPDIVFASCGDTPNIETLAAVSILKKFIPNIKLRVLNILEVLKLESDKRNPFGLTDTEFNAYFTKDKPVIFDFHGYPAFIHSLLYDRENKNFLVHGYLEEGSITTAFDMRLRNKIDRFSLLEDALNYLPDTKEKEALKEYIEEELKKHYSYVKEYGLDLEEITNFALE